MGSTYTNTTVKGPRQNQVVAYLQEQRQTAIVTPTFDDLTFIYAPDRAWSTLAEQLSRAFHCPALFAFVYDSDIFRYTLFRGGEILDEYDSAPDSDATAEKGILSEAAPTGGDARVLCRAFAADQASDRVHEILHPPVLGAIRHARIYADDQHRHLAEALGWPPTACECDYRHLIAADRERRDLERALGDAPLTVVTP